MPWKKKYWGEPAFDRVNKLGFTEVGSKKFKVGKGLIYELKNLKPWKELLKVQIPILFIMVILTHMFLTKIQSNIQSLLRMEYL